jgi:peptidoglycan LD-endopeptidase LytH
MSLNGVKITDVWIQREAALNLSGILPIKQRRNLLLILLGVFVILFSVVLLNLTTPHESVLRKGDPADDKARHSKDTPEASKPNIASKPIETKPEIAPPPAGANVSDDDVNYLASRNLLVPLAGISASQLHDTYNEARSEGRQHNALDIKAPQGTAVLATTDGAVVKLFRSDKGGITLYQLDPSGRYVYYYAHLMRYEPGVVEGKQLRRGDVIAYVGDTGNAGPGNYHLHFAISKLTSPTKWSGGDPINPYPLFVRK